MIEEEQAIDEHLEKMFETSPKATEKTLQSIDVTLKSIDRTLIQLQIQFSVSGVLQLSSQPLIENSID